MVGFVLLSFKFELHKYAAQQCQRKMSFYGLALTFQRTLCTKYSFSLISTILSHNSTKFHVKFSTQDLNNIKYKDMQNELILSLKEILENNILPQNC